MNRNTRLVVVLTVAVFMAALASFGVYLAVRSIPERRVEIAHIQTLVAVRPLPVGTLVTKDDVKLVAWPAANPVPGSYTDVQQVVNRGLIASVAENEPLTDAKLAKAGMGAGLPPTIPEGMRALSVSVNEVIGVAGFVIPGTRVDVLVTINGNGGSNDSMSRVVVSNVQVLTAGTRFDQERAQQEGKPIPTSVVTLLVTPDDAEKIVLASNEGRIMLTLRNPLDQAPTQTDGVRRVELLGAPAPPPVVKVVSGRKIVRAAAPPPPEAPKIYTVETIRAAKRTEEPVR
jgi:pilus assembly protein CpaB